jgi:hypothetical protein
MPSIECSIVIFDQYYENSHFLRQCKCVEGTGDLMLALC